ncbi:MAG: signal peptidase I [Bacteroidales bacterium]|nr:signal peptidase I [Bacteroidales bacterium]
MNAEDDQRKVLRDLADELLDKGTSIRINASGYSMYPAIRPGNIIIIKPVVEEDLKCGSIIAWKREKDLVVHRLVLAYESDNKKYYITRGDSCRSSDSPVTHDMIAGRVEAIYKGHRLVAPAMKHPISERRYRLNRFKTIFLGYFHKIF